MLSPLALTQLPQLLYPCSHSYCQTRRLFLTLTLTVTGTGTLPLPLTLPLSLTLTLTGTLTLPLTLTVTQHHLANGSGAILYCPS